GSKMIDWAGEEGYNYPCQLPDAEVWSRLVDGIAQTAERLASHGRLLFLEHKNSEPAMKLHMSNVGMTLHVISKLRARGIDNVKVNMDLPHLIMHGENHGEYDAPLAAERLLGYQHANSDGGEVPGRAEEAYPLSTPRPGWAGQDPDDWVRAAEPALSRLDATDVGFSGQMHGLGALGQDDVPLRPAILWNDQRTGAQC